MTWLRYNVCVSVGGVYVTVGDGEVGGNNGRSVWWLQNVVIRTEGRC